MLQRDEIFLKLLHNESITYNVGLVGGRRLAVAKKPNLLRGIKEKIASIQNRVSQCKRDKV